MFLKAFSASAILVGATALAIQPGSPPQAKPLPEVIPATVPDEIKEISRAMKAQILARKVVLPPGEVSVLLQDMEWLDSLSRVDDFMRYLELSPDWNVTVRGGAAPRVTANLKDDVDTTWIFGPLGRSAPEQLLALPAVVVAPGAGKTLVPRRGAYKDQAYASLGVDAPMVSLVVMETSADAKLTKLQSALDKADATIKGFRLAVEAADREVPGAIDSAITRLAARKPDRVGEAAISVSSPNAGRQTIEAWINPGERGVTSLRVRETKTGKRWNLLRSEPMLNQRLPWSDDPTHLFLFSAKAAVMEAMTGWNGQHEVTFEVWFTPDWPTRPERILIEKSMTIPGWER